MPHLASPAGRVRSALSPLFAAFALMLLCTSAARADSFTAGEFVTYGQIQWGDDPEPRALLTANFDTVYSNTGGYLQIGIPAGYFAVFSDAPAIESYLPSSGPFGPLTENLVDPDSTSAGVYGGDVVGLALDVDFSAAGLLAHPQGIPLGNLYLTGFDGSSCGLQGMTVSDFLALNDTLVGGGATGSCSIIDIEQTTEAVQVAFLGGIPSLFADNHLTETNPNGGTMATPEPSSLLLLASGLVALGALRCWQRRQGIVLSDGAFQPKGN